MDCQTGEVVKIDTNMPNINSPGGNDVAPQSGTLPDTQEQNSQGSAPKNSGDAAQNVPSSDEN